jgi:hypothetical protein
MEHVAGGFGSVVGNDYFHGVAFVLITMVIGVESGGDRNGVDPGIDPIGRGDPLR